MFGTHSKEAEISETILVVLTFQKSLQYLPTKLYGILFMRHLSLYGKIAGQYSKRQLKRAVGRQETPRLTYGGENCDIGTLLDMGFSDAQVKELLGQQEIF